MTLNYFLCNSEGTLGTNLVMCYIPPFATSNCNNVQLFIIMLCLSYGNYYNELSYQELIVLRNLELSVLCDSTSLLLKKKNPTISSFSTLKSFLL